MKVANADAPKVWVPSLRIILDTELGGFIFQLTAWTGKTGTPPDEYVGQYVATAGGWTTDKSLAALITTVNADLIWRGDWLAANSYLAGQMVMHGGFLWIALAVVNANQPAPAANNAAWDNISQRAAVDVARLLPLIAGVPDGSSITTGTGGNWRAGERLINHNDNQGDTKRINYSRGDLVEFGNGAATRIFLVEGDRPFNEEPGSVAGAWFEMLTGTALSNLLAAVAVNTNKTSNVRADWQEVNPLAQSYINGKPTVGNIVIGSLYKYFQHIAKQRNIGAVSVGDAGAFFIPLSQLGNNALATSGDGLVLDLFAETDMVGSILTGGQNIFSAEFDGHLLLNSSTGGELEVIVRTIHRFPGSNPAVADITTDKAFRIPVGLGANSIGLRDLSTNSILPAGTAVPVGKIQMKLIFNLYNANPNMHNTRIAGTISRLRFNDNARVLFTQMNPPGFGLADNSVGYGKLADEVETSIKASAAQLADTPYQANDSLALTPAQLSTTEVGFDGGGGSLDNAPSNAGGVRALRWVSPQDSDSSVSNRIAVAFNLSASTAGINAIEIDGVLYTLEVNGNDLTELRSTNSRVDNPFTIGTKSYIRFRLSADNSFIGDKTSVIPAAVINQQLFTDDQVRYGGEIYQARRNIKLPNVLSAALFETALNNGVMGILTSRGDNPLASTEAWAAGVHPVGKIVVSDSARWLCVVARTSAHVNKPLKDRAGWEKINGTPLRQQIYNGSVSAPSSNNTWSADTNLGGSGSVANPEFDDYDDIEFCSSDGTYSGRWRVSYVGWTGSIHPEIAYFTHIAEGVIQHRSDSSFRITRNSGIGVIQIYCIFGIRY
ncbi:MAG: hypothetical protein ACR2PR_09190 [Pseudohongiellaceae bacterium]